MARKRLCQALESLRIKTCRKYVTLFFILIFSFFFVNSIPSAEAFSLAERGGQTLTVRANVSLTPEFIYSIQKNSSIFLSRAAFALDEEINVRVKIIGGNNFPLREHQINLQVVNMQGAMSLVLSGKTDDDGGAHFSFVAGAEFLGKHTLRVVDVTYDEPIVISKERVFVVYKPSGGQRERELTEQKIITHHKLSAVEVTETDVHILPNINNGTIIAYHQTKIVRKWSNDP